MDWKIAREALGTLRAHAERAAPEEACGLLLGERKKTGLLISEARGTANIAVSPMNMFEIDPAALFRAHREARSGGLALLGYYHSHPDGSAEPSATDAAHAAPDGKLWIIVGTDVMAWTAGETGIHGRFRPISLTIA